MSRTCWSCVKGWEQWPDHVEAVSGWDGSSGQIMLKQRNQVLPTHQVPGTLLVHSMLNKTERAHTHVLSMLG